ncbi:DUF5132 domain-containing protein [Brevibacillus sp. SYSU BS000544]|uniref:DUF5132 domain-containing protein n=1 Tax=Brevibacillus sp. SYSU BS000544 TaxID=3416443 RepID=UPI003CE4F5E5
MLNRSMERMVVSTALVLGASVLLPIAKTTLNGLLSSTRTGVKFAREELEDMIAEAQYERMKKQIDKEIME